MTELRRRVVHEKDLAAWRFSYQSKNAGYAGHSLRSNESIFVFSDLLEMTSWAEHRLAGTDTTSLCTRSGKYPANGRRFSSLWIQAFGRKM